MRFEPFCYRLHRDFPQHAVGKLDDSVEMQQKAMLFSPFPDRGSKDDF